MPTCRGRRVDALAATADPHPAIAVRPADLHPHRRGPADTTIEAKAIETVFQAVHRNDPDPNLLRRRRMTRTLFMSNSYVARRELLLARLYSWVVVTQYSQCSNAYY